MKENQNTVDANPTKDFFITMLTRDISLLRSIVDLVDNSVDAANQCSDISNRYVRISLSKDSFTIYDNCGGIDIEIAKHQAFRFGRPSNAQHQSNSVGRFGVGMKRTLFKMGRHFTVTSHHEDNSFSIEVDVDKWLRAPTWDFELNTIQRASEELGTKIEVKRLHEFVKDEFVLVEFSNLLIREIGAAHFKALHDGLSITVNETKVEPRNIRIKRSEQIGVVGVSREFDDVAVTVKAGVGPREKSEGGWYIVCNGRLVEGPEQTSVTGWGSDGIPKYHPDYAFFRGLVEFQCAEADKLPWTTTKTGIDVDNSVFKSARNEMKSTMRKVLSFLRDRAKEKEDFDKNLIEAMPLNEALDGSAEVSIYEVNFEENFKHPERSATKSAPEEINVQYRVSRSMAELVKESLGVVSASEMGRETFNYYFRNEIDQ